MNESATVRDQRKSWLGLLLLVLLAIVVTWSHLEFIVGQKGYANRDFMSLWTGGKALLLGLDPYDEAVWRPLRAAYGSTWMPDPRAPFPLWTFIMTAPFALLPVREASAVWLTVQESLLVLCVYLIANVLQRRQPKLLEMGVLLLFAFTVRPTLLVLNNGQLTFLLLACLVLFLICVDRNRPLAAGMLLPFLALKPNPFVLLVPLLGLWLLWRRQWRLLAGSLLSAAGMILLTNAIQPGWILEWFAVRSKTSVVAITPTLWGLASEVGGAWWAPLGLILVMLTTGAVGYVVFSRPQLEAPAVANVGLASSLLVTPYAWAYEHALLILPWLWVYFHLPGPRHKRVVWLIAIGALPWLSYVLAASRADDRLGFIVPFVTLCALLWMILRRGQASKQVRDDPGTFVPAPLTFVTGSDDNRHRKTTETTDA